MQMTMSMLHSRARPSNSAQVFGPRSSSSELRRATVHASPVYASPDSANLCYAEKNIRGRVRHQCRVSSKSFEEKSESTIFATHKRDARTSGFIPHPTITLQDCLDEVNYALPSDEVARMVEFLKNHWGNFTCNYVPEGDPAGGSLVECVGNKPVHKNNQRSKGIKKQQPKSEPKKASKRSLAKAGPVTRSRVSPCILTHLKANSGCRTHNALRATQLVQIDRLSLFYLSVPSIRL